MEEALTTDTKKSWTDQEEKLLKKWHQEAIAFYFKHKLSARKYQFRDRALGVPTTIANAITGTAIFITLDDESRCYRDKTIQIVIGVILIISAILIAVQNFLSLSQNAEKHLNSANKYKSFANSIESELVLKREERLNAKIFIKYIQKRFNELYEICPNISNSVEKEYRKISKNFEVTFFSEIIIDDGENNSENNGNKDENKDKNNGENDDNTNGSEKSDKEKTLQEQIDEEVEIMKIKDELNKIQKDNLKSSNRKKIDRFLDHF